MNQPATENLQGPRHEFLRNYGTTGPGTPGGEFLRRYWHPVCLSKDLRDLPYPVRMLSENLVAFRTPDGKTGLVSETCPHRLASLVYGQVTPKGLMCSYHGWTFDHRGKCVEQPLEQPEMVCRLKWSHVWYPTEEWGGVVWCYMGPDKENPPPLPKIDILARTDGDIVLERGDMRPYSYLNFAENFVDMGHVYVMHLLEPGIAPPELEPYIDRTVELNWRKLEHRVFETTFGIKCVVVHPTADPNKKFVNTWSLVLPCHFRFGGMTAGLPPDLTDDRREAGGMFRIIDDTSFELFRYQLVRKGNHRADFYNRGGHTARGMSGALEGSRERKDYDFREHPNWEGLPALEDYVLQKSQGANPDRTREILGASDIGIGMLRRIYRTSMEAVARGEKPKLIQMNDDGIVEADTFKGFIEPSKIVLSPENMPSSKGGEGLIRDKQGNLVF